MNTAEAATEPDIKWREQHCIPPLSEVVQRTGATYRQLDYWARVGYIHPTREAKGTGFPRTWPDEEIEAARLIVEFLQAGLVLAAAHHAARNGGLLLGGKFQVSEVAA